MSRLAAIIEAELLGQAPSPGPAFPAPPDFWPNGFAWRKTLRFDSSSLPAAVSGARATIVLDVTGRAVELDGSDVRVEDDFGTRLPHRLMRHLSGTAVLRVRLPTLSNNSDTLVHVYAGKAGANDADVAGVYAGLLLALDPDTGADLTGQGRSLVPSGGLAPAVLDTGEPGAYLDGTGVLSLAAAAPWLANQPELSISAFVHADAALTNAIARVFSAGSAAIDADPNDSIVLRRLATTSGGATNVWNAGVVTASSLTAYVLGSTGTATAGQALLQSSWVQGQAPRMWIDGAPMPESVSVARDGASLLRADGVHVGAGWQGKLGELLVAPYAYDPVLAEVEARARLRPLALWGETEWHGQGDAEPCVAMPVRAVVTGGTTIDVDVLASAVGTGLSLEAVIPGPRGSVAIVAGQARYTATGLESGSSWFHYVVEDAGGRQSTGRVDVLITAGVPAEPPPPSLVGYLSIPAPQSTSTTSNSTLVNDVLNAPAGQHLLVPPGTYAARELYGPNGTEAAPIVLKPLDPDNPPVLTGYWPISGGVWLVAMDVDGRALLAGNKSLRFSAPLANGVAVAYCRVRNGGIGIEFNISSGAKRFRVHRNYFDGSEQPQGTGQNGFEPVKFGVNAGLLFETENLMDYCKLVNFTAEDEALKLACSLNTILRCHWINSSRVGNRQGNKNSFIECRVEAGAGSNTGRMTFFGSDSLIRNCISKQLLIWRGNRDSDALTTGGSFWGAATRTVIQRHALFASGSFQINGYPFSNTTGFTFPAKDTLVSDSVAPTLLNGATAPGLAGSVPFVTPVTLADSDVGPAAYRTWLAAQ